MFLVARAAAIYKVLLVRAHNNKKDEEKEEKEKKRVCTREKKEKATRRECLTQLAGHRARQPNLLHDMVGDAERGGHADCGGKGREGSAAGKMR